MLRWLAFVLLFFSVACASGPPVQSLPITGSSIGYSIALRSSVSLELPCENCDTGWHITGSGTIIRDSKQGLGIVTAAHVADNNPLLACSLLDRDQCVWLGDYIINSDPSRDDDWAWYPVDEKPRGAWATHVNQRMLPVGTDVIQVGNPKGHPWVNNATVAWISTEEDEPLYWLDGFALPGSSGGGVFNSNGALVGIIVAGHIHEDRPSGIDMFTNQEVVVVPVRNIDIL